MAGLGEEPTLGEQSCRLHRQRHHQPPASARAQHRHAHQHQRRGECEQLPTRVWRTLCSDARWKNSRVLNEPPVMPMARCTSCGLWIPVALLRRGSVASAPGVAAQRQGAAPAMPRKRRGDGPAAQCPDELALPSTHAGGARQHQPGRQADQGVVDDRQRMGPFWMKRRRA